MSATADEQLAFAGPAALAELVRSRQVAPTELVELCLRRIDRLDPHLNAFRTVVAERALEEARERDGHDGPLAGVPVAIKDEMPLAGQPLMRGSRAREAAPGQDSEIVRRLRAAGAIPIGVTNVPELTIWPWTASRARGVTRNPWDLSRTPGGSSGGSAAAVAAGMVPAATAADGGGSIRIPAACCGLVGMKPTRGRVSLMPLGEDSLALGVYGTLARTVRDSALLLDVTADPAAGDRDAPSFARSHLEATGRSPGRLRIAVSDKIPPAVISRLFPDQRAGWERMGRTLTELGHEVIDRDPAYGLAQLEFTQCWVRGVYETSLRFRDRSQFEPSTRQMIAAGRYLVPPRRRRALMAMRAASTARLLALWDEVDVLLTPGLATTAIAAEGAFGRSAIRAIDMCARFTPYTPVFNLTGQPAVSLPAGTGSDGLPLSVQLVGRPGAEGLLYALAAQIEEAHPWADRRPSLEADRV